MPSSLLRVLDSFLAHHTLQVVSGGDRCGVTAMHTYCAGDTWYVDLARGGDGESAGSGHAERRGHLPSAPRGWVYTGERDYWIQNSTSCIEGVYNCCHIHARKIIIRKARHLIVHCTSFFPPSLLSFFPLPPPPPPPPPSRLPPPPPIPLSGILFLNNCIPHWSLENYSDKIHWSLDLCWQYPSQSNGF